MRADIGLFFSTVMIIAVVSLLVRYGTNTAKIATATTTGLTGLYGVLETGNPQFYANAKGY